MLLLNVAIASASVATKAVPSVLATQVYEQTNSALALIGAVNSSVSNLINLLGIGLALVTAVGVGLYWGAVSSASKNAAKKTEEHAQHALKEAVKQATADTRASVETAATEQAERVLSIAVNKLTEDYENKLNTLQSNILTQAQLEFERLRQEQEGYRQSLDADYLLRKQEWENHFNELEASYIARFEKLAETISDELPDLPDLRAKLKAELDELREEKAARAKVALERPFRATASAPINGIQLPNTSNLNALANLARGVRIPDTSNLNALANLYRGVRLPDTSNLNAMANLNRGVRLPDTSNLNALANLYRGVRLPDTSNLNAMANLNRGVRLPDTSNLNALANLYRGVQLPDTPGFATVVDPLKGVQSSSTLKQGDNKGNNTKAPD